MEFPNQKVVGCTFAKVCHMRSIKSLYGLYEYVSYYAFDLYTLANIGKTKLNDPIHHPILLKKRKSHGASYGII